MKTGSVQKPAIMKMRIAKTVLLLLVTLKEALTLGDEDIEDTEERLQGFVGDIVPVLGTLGTL